jgi:hypothetical protein
MTAPESLRDFALPDVRKLSRLVRRQRTGAVIEPGVTA